jgi:hypothetical protein
MNVEFESDLCEGKQAWGQADGAISAWWGSSGGSWWSPKANWEGYTSSGGESHSGALKAKEQVLTTPMNEVILITADV